MKVKSSLKPVKGYKLVRRWNKSHTKCRIYRIPVGRKKQGQTNPKMKARQG